MTNCTRCNTFQQRLNRRRLCDACYEAQAEEEEQTDEIDPEFLNKPMSELVVADIMRIVSSANGALSRKIDHLKSIRARLCNLYPGAFQDP